MAHLYRLIVAAFVLLFAWLPLASHAAFPVPTVYLIPSCGFSQEFPSMEAAGNACLADRTAWLSSHYEPTTATLSVESPYIFLNYSPKSMGIGQYLVHTQASCPANSMQSGSNCSCNVGYTQAGSSCVVLEVNNCPKAGTSAGRWSYPYPNPARGMSTPYYVCDGETPAGSSDGALCVVKVIGDIAVGSGAEKMAYGEAVFTGGKSATCNGNGGQGGGTGDGSGPSSANSQPPVQGEPAPTPCKAGYAPGTVNGQTSCYPAGSTGQPVTTPGSSTGSTSVDGNSPTVTGIESSTECKLGRCTTTTTTTTTTNGTSTSSTSTKEESQGDFCKDNPKSMQCVTSSWGGSCTANFTCDGDAIMCAMSQEQHKRNCQLFEQGAAGDAALQAEKDKAQLSESSVNIGPSSFSVDPLIGTGSCIADRSITVMGTTVTVPFSGVCGHLAMLGNMLVAVTFLLASRIVVRG